MTVYGILITPEQERACLERMNRAGLFTQGAITRVLVDAGVPYFTQDNQDHLASEVTNRLLQRERKAGRIRWDGKVWWTVKNNI